MRVSVDGGKYTYVITETNAHVLRYGKLWKDATGDKFTYSMAAEIESLREQVEKLENRLNKDSQEFTILCAKETEKVLREQLAALAEQNEKQRAFLEFAWKDIPMNEYAFKILEHVMNLPNLATPVLNRIRADGMRMAAEILIDPVDRAAAQKICAQADELEKQNG